MSSSRCRKLKPMTTSKDPFSRSSSNRVASIEADILHLLSHGLLPGDFDHAGGDVAGRDLLHAGGQEERGGSRPAPHLQDLVACRQVFPGAVQGLGVVGPSPETRPECPIRSRSNLGPTHYPDPANRGQASRCSIQTAGSGSAFVRRVDLRRRRARSHPRAHRSRRRPDGSLRLDLRQGLQRVAPGRIAPERIQLASPESASMLGRIVDEVERTPVDRG